MAGASDLDAATVRQPRQRDLIQIKTSVLHLLISLRNNAIQREESLEQECALQRDSVPRLKADLLQEIEIVGQLALPIERAQLQGLMHGTEHLRTAMEQRRAEIQQEFGRLRAYKSAIHMAESLIMGHAVLAGSSGGTGTGPKGP